MACQHIFLASQCADFYPSSVFHKPGGSVACKLASLHSLYGGLAHWLGSIDRAGSSVVAKAHHSIVQQMVTRINSSRIDS